MPPDFYLDSQFYSVVYFHDLSALIISIFGHLRPDEITLVKKVQRFAALKKKDTSKALVKRGFQVSFCRIFYFPSGVGLCAKPHRQIVEAACLHMGCSSNPIRSPNS